MAEVGDAPRIKALLDENMPPEIGEWLRARRPSWEVSHVYDVGLQNRPDEEIFEWALSNGFLIITFDATFADGRKFPVPDHYGIVRLRVWPTTLEIAENALARLSDEFQDEQLVGCVVIIKTSSIRRISGSPPQLGGLG